LIESLAVTRGLHFLGWRNVPTDPAIVGPSARDTLPVIEQCFLAPQQEGADLEGLLFALREACETILTAIEAVDPVTQTMIEELRLEVESRLRPSNDTKDAR